MSKEIKDFAEKAKEKMIGWSQTINDPHARVYARAFSSIVDECVDELEYEQKKRKMNEIADKLSLMGYRILSVGEQEIDVLREGSDPLLDPPLRRTLNYEEAIKLVEGKK